MTSLQEISKILIYYFVKYINNTYIKYWIIFLLILFNSEACFK